MPTSYVVHDLIGFWDREWMHMRGLGHPVWGLYSYHAFYHDYNIPTPFKTDEARRRGGHGRSKGHVIHGACTR